MRGTWRRRVRAVGRWGGVVVCVMIVALWVVSRWRLVTMSGPGSPFAVVFGGVVQAEVDPRSPFGGGARFFGTIPAGEVGAEPRLMWWWWGCESRTKKGAGGVPVTVIRVVFPMRLPCVVVAMPTGWLWWRGWRRRAPGACAKCGYDLSGLGEGAVCPECGGK